MKASLRNDFRVFETVTPNFESRWEIRTSGSKGDRITTCRSAEEAQEQCKALNLNPYYFDLKARHNNKI